MSKGVTKDINDDVWIVDFGSQYTQLITRRTRELGYKSVILTVEDALEKLKNDNVPLAFVLSGGPDSVDQDETNYLAIFDAGRPILGICYGMHLVARHYQGRVEKGSLGEYGHAQVYQKNGSHFQGLPNHFRVWMSHREHVTKMPEGFDVILTSENGLIAGIQSIDRKIMALQFHPEVNHTEHGVEIIDYFFSKMASIGPNWTDEMMLDSCRALISEAKGKKVLCAFSGGVDSLVAATLTESIIGNDLYCFFVDNGLLRPQDYQHIKRLQERTSLKIEVIDAKEKFLDLLRGVSEPEEKRKIIGKTFIEVFESKVKDYIKEHQIHFEYLLQGTLYPDVIESISPHKKGGKSVTIKSHHNVGGLPERMNLKLLEPLRLLFKDEVRVLGENLKLDKSWVHRHPFPGPGIGVRIVGEVKEESVVKVQKSDQILFEELVNRKLYDSCWQAFTVLLPIKTVGVKGDARAYEEVICVRIVDSTDGMTASWTRMPPEFLERVSRRITNEVPGVTRVVYDITSKPPGTIEWE